MTTPGTLLATRYRLIERIGVGGMATVWRANDLRLDRDVAVKILRPQFAEDPEFVERFEVEARHAASLSHPNVATVFDTGVDGPERFIVMELVDGASVADILRARGPLPVGQAVDVAAAAARALSAAHRRALIHRDVKPANILVGRDGRVRLADFGIARALTTTRVTAPGTVLGSIPYLSPEQARGEEASAAGDVFSLGVVLYEMLTGRLPWAGDSPAAMATVRTTEPPIPLVEARPDLPPGLQRIVTRALKLDPAGRYPSARAFAESLETWARRHASELPNEPDLAETAALVAAAPFVGAGGQDDALVAGMPAGQALAAAALAHPNPDARPEPAIQPERGAHAAGAVISARVAARNHSRVARSERIGRRRGSDDDRRAAAVLLTALVPIAALGVLIIAGAFRVPATNAPEGTGSAGDIAIAEPTVRSVEPSPSVSTLAATPSASPTPTPTPAPTATPRPTPRPTPTARPRPTATPRPARATPAPTTAAAQISAPARAVQRFYNAVEAHDWDTAIALWSPSMRERYPPQEWLIDRFKRTTRIDVTRLVTRSVNTGAGTANVAIRLVEYRTVEPSPRSFTGSWDLVLVNGRWKLNQPHF